MAGEEELFSFEGAQVKVDGDFYPTDEDLIDNEGEASNSESDLEIAESGGSLTEKEIHQMCGGRKQKRRPAISESESDSDPISKLSSSLKARGNQSKRHKSTLTAASKSSSVPSTPKVATPKTWMANTPKNVPRSAPPKRNLPSTLTPKSHGSTSTKNTTSPISADTDKEGGESLPIAVLQEISSKLNSVAERVVRMETKLEAMEKRRTPSSSNDARTPKQKRVIPHTLRVSVSNVHGCT